MKPFYESKKFWASVAAIVVAIVGHYAEIDPALQLKLVGVIVAYLATIMGADWGKEAKFQEGATALAIVESQLAADKERGKGK